MAMKPTAQTLDSTSDEVESPSKKLIRENAKAKSKVIVDELGRKIAYKSLGPLEQMRLYGALGDMSSNEAYSRYAMIAMSVQSIDDQPGPPPVKLSMIEARVEWIGEEGFSAIWGELIKSSKDYMDDRTPEEIAEEHKTVLKKSSAGQD